MSNIEVTVLGKGLRITQKQMLAELESLNAKADGAPWRLETKHELFVLVSRYDHKNAKGAYSTDDSIEPGWYWTDEETPWCSGGRVVVGFLYGGVYSLAADDRAFARAVRVSGQ